jgi:hypothetical protein
MTIFIGAATLTDRGGDPRGALGDLPPREPHHAPARERQCDVTLAIGLEGSWRAVVRVAVDLDDEQPCAPDEVDDVALDLDVGLRARDAVVVTEAEEALLELAARRYGAGGVEDNAACKEGRDRAVLEFCEVEPSALLGQVEGLLERATVSACARDR